MVDFEWEVIIDGDLYWRPKQVQLHHVYAHVVQFLHLEDILQPVGVFGN